jgi:hypothetical protein
MRDDWVRVVPTVLWLLAIGMAIGALIGLR